MTEGNTIDFLYYIKSRVVTERDKHHTVPQAYKFFQDRVDMCDMAIDALNSKSMAEEYRIPKKVCVFYENTIYGEQLDEVACPVCHAFFDDFRSNKPKYCPDCGQALDWSEVTE